LVDLWENKCEEAKLTAFRIFSNNDTNPRADWVSEPARAISNKPEQEISDDLF